MNRTLKRVIRENDKFSQGNVVSIREVFQQNQEDPYSNVNQSVRKYISDPFDNISILTQQIEALKLELQAKEAVIQELQRNKNSQLTAQLLRQSRARRNHSQMDIQRNDHAELQQKQNSEIERLKVVQSSLQTYIVEMLTLCKQVIPETYETYKMEYKYQQLMKQFKLDTSPIRDTRMSLLRDSKTNDIKGVTIDDCIVKDYIKEDCPFFGTLDKLIIEHNQGKVLSVSLTADKCQRYIMQINYPQNQYFCNTMFDQKNDDQNYKLSILTTYQSLTTIQSYTQHNIVDKIQDKSNLILQDIIVYHNTNSICAIQGIYYDNQQHQYIKGSIIGNELQQDLLCFNEGKEDLTTDKSISCIICYQSVETLIVQKMALKYQIKTKQSNTPTYLQCELGEIKPDNELVQCITEITKGKVLSCNIIQRQEQTLISSIELI